MRTCIRGQKENYMNMEGCCGSRKRALKRNNGDLSETKKNGLKFRRQHPLGNYIADFYCHEKRLVIELDGEIHDKNEQKERDNERTSWMNQSNINVISFRNEEVHNESKLGIKKIIDVADNINSPGR